MYRVLRSVFCCVCCSNILQHTATHCNTLRHSATHYNTLRYISTHCDTLQYSATHWDTLRQTATHRNTLRHTATHCNTLQHNVLESHDDDMKHTATHCNTLRHAATHCNTLDHNVLESHDDDICLSLSFHHLRHACYFWMQRWLTAIETHVSALPSRMWCITEQDQHQRCNLQRRTTVVNTIVKKKEKEWVLLTNLADNSRQSLSNLVNFYQTEFIP